MSMLRMTVLAAALAAASPAFAAPPAAAPDPMQALYACADKTADAERLACFDSEVKRLRAAQIAGDFAAVDRLKAETLRKEAFGFSLPSLPKLILPGMGDDKEPNLVVKVTSMTRGENPILRLDNGQTWTIIDVDKPPYQLKPGAEIEISRAALGSYLMVVKGTGKGLRIRRVE
ncbi:MAG: hypothetical protein ACOYM8_16310 [Caulobacterales bacterium]